MCTSGLMGTLKDWSKQFPLVNGENYWWLGAHGVGSVSWPLSRAGEEHLVGILQSPCQSLGRYTVGLRTHACRCLWNGHQSQELAPCLATSVIRSSLSPRRRGHMNVSLITFPCDWDVNPSWRNAMLAHTMHWKQPQAFLLSQVSGTVPCKSLFTYAIHRFYLVQCTVLQQPCNLHVLPDYLVIKPSKYKHTVIIV